MAITRRNFSTDPARKVASPATTTWFGPSGWARIDDAHASLPRSTAFAGSTAGDVAASRGGVEPDEWVVVSASVRFVAASLVRLNIDWFTGGGAYISTANGADYDQGADTTERIVSAVAQAPATSGRIQPNVVGVDGAAQITAVWIEKFATQAEAIAAAVEHADPGYYIDGDTFGGVWDGDDGESTSTWEGVHAALAGSAPLAVGAMVGGHVEQGVLGGSAPVAVGTLVAEHTALAVMAGSAPMPKAFVWDTLGLKRPLRAGTPSKAAGLRAGTPTKAS